jgi:hypothetical protein
MRKILCAMTAVMILTAYHASNAENLWVGLRAGPSIPRLSGGNNEVSRGYSSILAPTFGVIAEYPLTDRFSIQGELDYSGQGGVRKGMQPITIAAEGLPQMPPGQYLYASFKNESVLYYLEIPLMAKYHWEASEHWRYYVAGGPYLGFLLSAEQKTRGVSKLYLDSNGTPLSMGGQELPAMSFDANTKVKSDLNGVNAGITGGVGLEYLINERNQIFMDIRGEYGLRSVQKNTARDGASNTGAAVFSFGYKFVFGL